ncbi:hypothetical protein [Helicobacter mesocricetorum]|uniref:hypothetical protein n=1 Tax=Helicobacter mesocricetorum TaxID=87012 RepID=UPI001F1AE6F1|nr:hypothetical protein [Helicobacter mesocricetorum]
MKEYNLLIFSTSKPLKIGVYDGQRFLESFQMEGQLSDCLLPLFAKVCDKYPKVQTLFFINGPGSFMALKLVYIFAKTLAITKGIELLATNGFEFNGDSPIRAYGKSYFVRKKGQILLENFKELIQEAEYTFPPILNKDCFSPMIKPLYLLPAL